MSDLTLIFLLIIKKDRFSIFAYYQSRLLEYNKRSTQLGTEYEGLSSLSNIGGKVKLLGIESKSSKE